ncbi:TonB-dependent receptor [Pontibacter sp. G13]|uniref:SusC/RagA family TonB-linked outer membrane protein n=1 Tax=Pontibacter sp. G13 TaxID=3074898 RepID=UPI00288BED0A|nr:TonB-dependent receptor [Pontibacter sp. G13]WNJ19135.1 TonB-dependent receptor [Pontibacter sp. G13]
MKRTNSLLSKAWLGYPLLGLLFVCLMVMPQIGQAANPQTMALVSGKVFGANNEPLEGATVIVKNTSVGAFTDASGAFSLDAPDPANDILVISYIGYKRQEIALAGKTSIEVTMEEDFASTEEVVVIGYGSVEKKDLTGSVASVKATDFVQGTVISPEDLMNGKVAGVQMTTADGAPGGGVRVLVRGSTSILGNNQPLYIVDGVPIGNGGLSQNGVTENRVTTNPLSWLNPSDIASIDVLKGPSAQAIYGTRAAAGVVIITTKSGEAGSTVVEADIRVGVNNPRRYEVLSAEEFNQVRADNGLPSLDMGQQNNWQDSIMQPALSQVYSLGISGGNQSTNYYASVNYTNEDGTVRSTGYNKLNGRVKVEHKAIDDRLRLSFNITQSSEEFDASQIYPNRGRNNTGSTSPPLLGQMLIYNPTAPAYNEDGTYNQVDPTGQFFINPISIAEQPIDELHRQSFQGNLQASFEILDGLTYSMNLNYSNGTQDRGLYYPKAQGFPLGAPQGGAAWRRFQRGHGYLMESTLGYKREFNDNHRLDVLAGYSWQRSYNDGMQTQASNFLFDQTTFNSIGSTSSPELANFSSFAGGSTIISGFARANYSLMDRYLLTATFRTDGSDRFGPANQWGYFPSFAAAWRISEESFLSDVLILDDLKLRAEYGTIGNTPNGNYLGFLRVGANQYADGSGGYVNGVELANFPNEDLRWEKTSTFNVGLDFSFANGRVSGSFDFYDRMTEDLLLSYNVPSPSVFRTVTDNVGSMRNRGVEAALNLVLVNTGDFMFELGTNGAYNQNEVLSLSNNIFNIEDYNIQYGELFGAGFVGDNIFRIEEGQPIHNVYGLEWAGFAEDGTELFLDSLGNAVPLGDVNANGNPEKYFGSAVPTFTFSVTPSFRYKNFDMSIFLRGATGFNVVNNTFLQYASLSQIEAGNNVLSAALDNTEESISNVPEFSSRYVERGDFLRLDNLVLGYNFNTQAIKWVDNLRVYVSARNLALLTNYSGLDPEVFSTAKGSSVDVYGIDYLTYPRARNITFGVNVRLR